jgi:LDH2 family malate/lactate/ureidoglycolate dehydrogenase
VYYPGEIEHERTRRHLEDGVEVEEATWSALERLADVGE